LIDLVRLRVARDGTQYTEPQWPLLHVELGLSLRLRLALALR
jgi:hypothetical protein